MASNMGQTPIQKLKRYLMYGRNSVYDAFRRRQAPTLRFLPEVASGVCNPDAWSRISPFFAPE